jgi:hypothetical protein
MKRIGRKLEQQAKVTEAVDHDAYMAVEGFLGELRDLQWAISQQVKGTAKARKDELQIGGTTND